MSYVMAIWFLSLLLGSLALRSIAQLLLVFISRKSLLRCASSSFCYFQVYLKPPIDFFGTVTFYYHDSRTAAFIFSSLLQSSVWIRARLGDSSKTLSATPTNAVSSLLFWGPGFCFLDVVTYASKTIAMTRTRNLWKKQRGHSEWASKALSKL